jgi:hypothetical protein
MRMTLPPPKVILTVTTILFLSYNTTRAQWTTKLNLTPNAMNASLNENMGQCISVSGDTVHVVWSDKRTTGGAIYYRHSVDAGVTWSDPILLTDSTHKVSMPSIASSGMNVHVVYWDSSTYIHASSFYVGSLDGGNTWAQPVCRDTNTLFWPGVACSGNTVGMSLNKGAFDSTFVYYMGSVNNGTNWSDEQLISTRTGKGRSEDPAIAVNGSHIYLAWNDNRSGNMQIFYKRSTDGGANWGVDSALIHGPATSYSTMVCLDDSNVDVPCGDNRTGSYNVFIRHSSDSGSVTTWGNDKEVTYNTYLNSYPYMVRDSQNLYLVYYQIEAGVQQPGAWYKHSGNGGATWDTAYYLNATTAGGPFIALTNHCTLHVIFPDSGKIYYMQNVIGNCQVATGIDKKDNVQLSANLLSVYPNPASAQLTVKSSIESGIITITDVMGRELATTQLESGVANINTSSFSAGVYFITVKNNTGNILNENKFSVAR